MFTRVYMQVYTHTKHEFISVHSGTGIQTCGHICIHNTLGHVHTGEGVRTHRYRHAHTGTDSIHSQFHVFTCTGPGISTHRYMCVHTHKYRHAHSGTGCILTGRDCTYSRDDVFIQLHACTHSQAQVCTLIGPGFILTSTGRPPYRYGHLHIPTGVDTQP